MVFQSRPKRLMARRRKIEDETMGYLIPRKQPPQRLGEKAFCIKMHVELMLARR